MSKDGKNSVAKLLDILKDDRADFIVTEHRCDWVEELRKIDGTVERRQRSYRVKRKGVRVNLKVVVFGLLIGAWLYQPELIQGAGELFIQLFRSG